MITRIQQLAISDEGFVFDPSTGESFTVNRSGLLILKALKKNKPVKDIAASLQQSFDMAPADVERDVIDFVEHLRTYRLM